MRNLIAAVYFLLAMFGCNGSSSTFTTRASVDGVETLYSKTRIVADIARFECLGSSSGHCYYTLFARACVVADRTGNNAQCRPIEHFTMVTGDSREVVGLPSHFNFCVSHEDKTQAPDCVRNQPTTAAAKPSGQPQ